MLPHKLIKLESKIMSQTKTSPPHHLIPLNLPQDSIDTEVKLLHGHKEELEPHEIDNKINLLFLYN